jgi:hypothetical protein
MSDPIPDDEWMGWVQIGSNGKWHHAMQDSFRPERWRIACRRQSFSYRLDEIASYSKAKPATDLCTQPACQTWQS